MKSKKIILSITLWGCFSLQTCLSMEIFKPQELFALAKNNSWGAINTQLKTYGGNLDAANDDGLTLLHLAIRAGNTECVETLITKGANVNIHSYKGKALDQPKNRSWQNRVYTPLHCAAHMGNIVIMQLLLNAGADINSTYQNDESTPLHLATWFGHPACVEFLIKTGAQINKTNLAGSTPVHSAAWREKPECLKILIDKGAAFEDKNSTGTGNTPLYLAAKAGSLECLRILMERSPDKKFIVNLRCAGEGITPVQIAINRQRVQCIWDLIINGADINAKLKSKYYKDVLELAKNNKPLQNFIKHIQKNNKAPMYQDRDNTCFLCNKAYDNNDVILELTSCKDSFHARCFETYALQQMIKNQVSPLILNLYKNESKEDIEFNIKTSPLGDPDWSDIKKCPKCYNNADLTNRAELSVFFNQYF